MIFIPIGILCVCFLLAFIMNQCRKRAEKRLFAKRARCTASVIPRNFSIGQLVTLFYNPSNPTEIHVPIENEEATAKNFKVATIVIIIAAVLAEIITLVGFTIIGWEVILP